MGLSGKEYADLVAAYVVKNFGARGLTVYREVSMGKTIIGKNRHLDILVLHEASAAVLAIECKYQDTLGTVDEKIPYAIQDMQAMGVPVCLTYAGAGFSSGILHMLAACPIAAQCLPPADLRSTRDTRELDIALAMAFKFWDLVVANKKPFALPPEAPAVVGPAVVGPAVVGPAVVGPAVVGPAVVGPAVVGPAVVTPAAAAPASVAPVAAAIAPMAVAVATVAASEQAAVTVALPAARANGDDELLDVGPLFANSRHGNVD